MHLGIVPVSGGPTRWLEVGDTRNSYLIARAGWMPDSKNVYVIRTNRVQNKLEMFSINVESGAPATIFKESDPYWINLHGDARFLRRRQALPVVERARQRLQSHFSVFERRPGSKAIDQRRMGSEERCAVVAPDRVYYTSDEGNSLETQSLQVKLDGGDKRRLDKTPGTHNVSMGPGGSYYLDTHSSLTEPPSTTLHSGDGAELGVYRAADRRQIDEYEILPTEIVSFKDRRRESSSTAG